MGHFLHKRGGYFMGIYSEIGLRWLYTPQGIGILRMVLCCLIAYCLFLSRPLWMNLSGNPGFGEHFCHTGLGYMCIP